MKGNYSCKINNALEWYFKYSGIEQRYETYSV